jgi:hypothetical protein
MEVAMFPISWWEVIFISIPQTFLIIGIGFSLFNINIRLQKTIAAAIVLGIITYFLRRLPIPLGTHTIILTILLTLAVTSLSRIKLWYSLISVLLGAMVLGVIENVIMPIVLFFLSKTVNDLTLDPVLNIKVFLPTLLLAAFLFYLVKKLNFTLYDLGTRGNSQ